MAVDRRRVLGALGASAAVGLLPGRARAALTLPKGPVTVTVVDVSGDLALTQKAFESYRKARPDVVSRFVFTKAPATELPAKLKAQQDAGQVNIDLVLTGTDALSAGLLQGIWLDLGPYAADLPDLAAIYQPQAFRMQALAQGHGLVVAYYPSGPLLEYMPDRVKAVPKTAAELMDYTRQNSNRFIYARPSNSGPGRTWLMGLPYILGDSAPTDPVNGWSKTWDYLKALGDNIEYYPGGTTQTLKELGEGTRDMIVTTTGWDINPRALGIVPKEAEIAALDGFHWVTDAHYMAVPKGLTQDRIAVLIDLMGFMLQPKSQAFTYGQASFYPGPAVKGVTLAMAPQESQDTVRDYGRPAYAALIADHPLEIPLDAERTVQAFDLWDKRIGAGKG